MALATKTSAADWSIAYAVTIRRLDSQFMLCLLRLDSWPNLSSMHGDLVEAMKLICALLEKRPMVGFLVAHRLKLPVDKTYALLSVLQTKGHIVTVGANLSENDSVNHEQISSFADKPHLSLVGNGVDVDISEQVNPKSSDSGDVLNQLWRVLNTDISWSKAANTGEGKDLADTSNKDAGDVLGQLWRVLNTDITLKTDENNQPIAATEAELKLHQDKIDEAAGVMGQLWSVLNTDIAFKRVAGSSAKEDGKEGVEAKSKEVSDVLRQLWRVLNTEIANKRQAESKTGTESATDTTIEANDKLSKLWRILDTEITLKKKSKTYVMKDSQLMATKVSPQDTSAEAVSRLSQLWQVLNSEISVTVPPERRSVAVNQR